MTIKEFFDELRVCFDLNPDREQEQAVVSQISNGVSFRGANLWVLIFAILIASLGLNINSTAVIIGAMLISPLMGPIIGMGLAVGTNDIDWFTIDQYRANAETALSAAADKCSHLVVLSPPNNEGKLYPNQCELNEVDEVLTQICAEHGWEHISLYDAVDPTSNDLRDDHVHPTPAGAKKLWTAFSDRMSLPEALWKISIPQTDTTNNDEPESPESSE